MEDNSLRTPNLAENHIKHAAVDLKETVESIGDFVPPPPPSFEFEEEESISMPAPPQVSPPSPPSFVKNEEDADVQTEPKGFGAPVVNADKEGNTDREDLGKGDGEVSSVSKPNGREDEGPNESSSTVKFVETSGTPNAADLKGMKGVERSTSNVAEKAVECEIKTIPVPPTPNQFTKSALSSGIVGIERLPSTDSVHEEVETHPSIPETVLEAKGQPKQQNSVLIAPLEPLDSHKPSSEVSTQHPKIQCVPRYYSERDDGLCEDKTATAFQTATEAKESMQKDDDAALFMQPPNYPPPEFLDRAERTNQSPLDVAVKEILRKRQLRRRQNRVKVVPQRPSRASNDSKVLNQCKQVWSGYSGNESRSAHTLHRTAPRLEKPERIMVVGEGFTAFDTILRPFEDSVRILMHGDRFLAVEDTLQSTRAIRVSAWMDQGMNRMFWAKDRSFGQRRNVYLRDILQVCVEDSNSFRIMCAKVNGSSALEDDKSTVDVRLSHQEPSVVEQWVTSLLLLCNAAGVLQPGLSAIKQKRQQW